MSTITCAALQQLLARHTDTAAVHELSVKLDHFMAAPDAKQNELIALYQSALLVVEQTLGKIALDGNTINRYQSAYRELEALIQSQGEDTRHSFVIIIPIADRPLHLKECLNSLLDLCRAFDYGGSHDGRYKKVMALIADDSKEPENSDRHRELGAQFNALGLETHYFGLEEQLAQLKQLPDASRKRLHRIIGNEDKDHFYHKGPSILRNIVYLKLNEMRTDDEQKLFYFVDSDQEFRVKLSGQSGDVEPYLVNYLYQLDRHFSQTQISVLTGKVVGDPPVSPAVMAGTFLDDVIAFVEQLTATQHDTPCGFHGQAAPADAGAAYHDMAGLFGFENKPRPYSYRCPLPHTNTHAHTHADCFADFALRLNQFFDGVHPTRITYFNVGENTANTQAARTVYTGNYILRSSALRYFIPFATLRLRMAGPALGRLIQPELAAGFVSANLPLLHKRTVTQTGQSEYRPGVARTARRIDLSGEFERQYFGDIMLFSLEKLIAAGYPQHDVSDAAIEQILFITMKEMQQRYTAMQSDIMLKLTALNGLIENEQCWQSSAGDPAVKSAFRDFSENIAHNFGPVAKGFQHIRDPAIQALHQQRIHTAIKHYAQDRVCWDAVMGAQKNPKHQP